MPILRPPFVESSLQSFMSGIGNWMADEVLYQVCFPDIAKAGLLDKIIRGISFLVFYPLY